MRGGQGVAYPVHNHGVQCRFRLLIWRAPKPHCEIALCLLTGPATLQGSALMNMISVGGSLRELPSSWDLESA
jgi:hypothetical protein